MRLTRRTGLRIGTATATLAALAGCAQPGQLGHPAQAPAPETVTVTAPPPAPGPETVGQGVVDVPLRVRTPAQADYAVRTLVLAPGEAIDWETHPGTELTLVDAGELTVREGVACAPRVVPAGRVLAVGEGVPHLVVNTGTRPARLVVTTLLAPGLPTTTPVPPACV